MNNKELVEDGMEIIDSLYEAIYKAGGTIEAFSVKKLKEKSAYDLISLFATNKIRFIHKEGEENEGRKITQYFENGELVDYHIKCDDCGLEGSGLGCEHFPDEMQIENIELKQGEKDLEKFKENIKRYESSLRFRPACSACKKNFDRFVELKRHLGIKEGEEENE